MLNTCLALLRSDVSVLAPAIQNHPLALCHEGSRSAWSWVTFHLQLQIKLELDELARVISHTCKERKVIASSHSSHCYRCCYSAPHLVLRAQKPILQPLFPSGRPGEVGRKACCHWSVMTPPWFVKMSFLSLSVGWRKKATNSCNKLFICNAGYGNPSPWEGVEHFYIQ